MLGKVLTFFVSILGQAKNESPSGERKDSLKIITLFLRGIPLKQDILFRSKLAHVLHIRIFSTSEYPSAIRLTDLGF